ncbi:AAA family ATPase [Ferroplasma sp.]|uniref:McrB family protein n=1 Tax=Ferroplasma sp. TaxID=2591003 RepID=UPI00262BFD0A|nr:AAA family ATPase [Ferroplasma sp.]
MEILQDSEKQELKNYYDHAINAGDYWAQKRKEHDKHQEVLSKYLSKDNLNLISQDDLKKLLVELWATSQRFKSISGVEKRILKNNNNDFKKIIEGIKDLLYGQEYLEDRINTFSKNINYMKLAYTSEMLHFVYPDKYPLWNLTTEAALEKISPDNLLSYIKSGTYSTGKEGQKYKKIIEVMTAIKNSIEKDENIKLDFIDVDILIIAIQRPPDSFASDKENLNKQKLKSKNFIFNGPVGTGKSEFANILAKKIIENKILSVSEIEQLLKDFNKGDLPIKKYDDERLKKVTFHPSYGYEDFIMGLKAEVDKKNNIKYEYRNGIFKELSYTADKDPKNNYVMIIDEINRGDISRIFGELITLVEESKRGDKIELPYKDGEDFIEFIVPQNLYIIGTMNDSDKSIALLDSALRRRFMFFRIDPKPDIVDKWYNSNKIIHDTFKILNDRISNVKGSDYVIGHAFLKPEDDVNEMENFMHIFRYKIIPLLQEYFYGDKVGLENVLGKAFNDDGSIKYNSFDKVEDFKEELQKIQAIPNGN